MGRLRLCIDMLVVCGILVLLFWGIDATYRAADTRRAVKAQPPVVSVRPEAILGAYMFLASAVPGVTVEAELYPQRTIYVNLPRDPEPDLVDALHNLETVLPLAESHIRVVLVGVP